MKSLIFCNGRIVISYEILLSFVFLVSTDDIIIFKCIKTTIRRNLYNNVLRSTDSFKELCNI